MKTHFSSQPVGKTETLSVMERAWPDKKINGLMMQKRISGQKSSFYFKYSEKVLQNYALPGFTSGSVLSIQSNFILLSDICPPAISVKA